MTGTMKVKLSGFGLNPTNPREWREDVPMLLEFEMEETTNLIRALDWNEIKDNKKI